MTTDRNLSQNATLIAPEAVPVSNLVEMEDFILNVVAAKTLPTNNRLYNVLPFFVPGIGAAAAYASDDQFGAVFTFSAPAQGVIRDLRFHDRDNEGIDKEIWLFDVLPTLAADNAAFSLSDADNTHVIAVFAVTTWRLAVNNQIGFTANTPAAYTLSGVDMSVGINPDANGTVWGAVKTKGADNIAAGSEPLLSFVIERWSA